MRKCASSRSWTAGCGESYLSGAGSAGRNSTAERQHGRRPSTPFDNPPALGWLTLNSFTASDHVLVVVSPGYFELDSLVQLGKTLEEVRAYFNPHLTLLDVCFVNPMPVGLSHLNV